MIDSVAGMMNAPPMPMSAAGRDQLVGDVDERRQQRAEPEHDHAELQRARAAEAVAEAARGEQQAREHERVRVDHPLELAVRRVEVVCTSVGIATLRIELSTMITSRLRQSTPRIHQRRWYERLSRSNGSERGRRGAA